jgi:hypothetical protein
VEHHKIFLEEIDIDATSEDIIDFVLPVRGVFLTTVESEQNMAGALSARLEYKKGMFS